MADVPPPSNARPSLLYRVLQFDALTGVASLPLALASPWLAPLLGVQVIYLAIKFALFSGYGVWLFAVLRRTPLSGYVGLAAIGFNTLVTLESAVMLVTQQLTGLGIAFFALQVVAGPVLIAVQIIAARRRL